MSTLQLNARPALLGARPPIARSTQSGRPLGVARHAGRVRARARLEDALRSIAVDLLGPGETDDVPAVCAVWITATTDAAVATVCDAALEGLLEALDRLLADVPPEVAHRLDEARARKDAGFI